MRVAALVVVVLLIVAGTSAPAGAQGATPRITWCGSGPDPVLTLDGLLPGDRRTVRVELCNEGSAGGVLAIGAWTAGHDAHRVDVDVDGVSVGPLTELASPVAVEGSWLPPAGRRSYLLGVTLDASLGNQWANRTIDIDLLITLSAVAAPAREPEGGSTEGQRSLGPPQPAAGRGAGTDPGPVVLGEAVLRVGPRDGVGGPGTGASRGSGPLARTGQALTTPVAVGCALVLGGVLAVIVARCARPATPPPPRHRRR